MPLALTHAQPLYYHHPHHGGSPLITDDPSLTPYHRSKSVVDISVHSWCCIACGFGQMHNDMYILVSE